jgi:hypothetical protein
VENEKAYVCGEENIVWGLLDGLLLERFRVVMLRDTTICLICTVTKLCVSGSEDLLGGRRFQGIYKAVVLIVLADGVVFGGSCDGRGERK